MSSPPDTSTPSLATRGRAAFGDRAFWLLSLGAGLLVLAILALILITTVREAWPAFRYAGFDFITSTTWYTNDPDGNGPRYGALAYIYGTAYTSLIALVFAVPVSIGIALYLTEFAPRWVRGPVVTVIDVLASLPSVVLGLWGVTVFGPWILPAFRGLHDVIGGLPVLGAVFGQPAGPRSFAAAGIVVAIMIVPIITSVTREVFATVPTEQKQAALALGATRWEMIRGAVFTHSFGGMVGAIILGLGRAMGETIAVSLMIGGSVQVTANMFASGNTLAAVIAQNWSDPGVTPGRSALIALGVILFAMTIVVNYVARAIVRRAEIRMKGVTA